MFLDTIHVFVNDPDHAVYDGTRALAERLRAASPACCWPPSTTTTRCSRSSRCSSARTGGATRPGPRRYALRFAHLCEGEPEGRTGVHEFGVLARRGRDAPPDRPAPGFLPTLAFQDDTLARSRARVEAALEAAAEGAP